MCRPILPALSLLLLLTCTSEPAAPPHPARPLAEAEVLPTLEDSASYVFKQLFVDTVTAAEAVARAIAVEEDRLNQRKQRLLLKARRMLAASGTEVSDEELARLAGPEIMAQLEDPGIRRRIDSLSALKPSPGVVDRYEVLLTYTSNDAAGVRREGYTDLIFDPGWRFVEFMQN